MPFLFESYARSDTTFFTATVAPKIATDVIIRDFPLTGPVGKDVPVKIQLVRKGTATGIYDKLLKITVKAPSGRTFKNEGRTDAYGMVIINVNGSFITEVGSYSLYGEFAGDEEFEGCD